MDAGVDAGVDVPVLLVLPVSLFSSFVVVTLIPPQGADANRLAPSSRHAELILSKRALRSAKAVSTVVTVVSNVVTLVCSAANAVSSVVILVVDAATVVSNVVTLVCSNANAVSIVLKRLKEQWFFVSVQSFRTEFKRKRKRKKIHSHYFACFCC